MDWPLTLGLMLGLLVLLMMLGLPVVFAFFSVNIVGAIIFLGGDAGLAQMVRNTQTAVGQFTLAPIPLFILMGEIMFRTGLAARAIDAVDRLITRVPGRLSLVAVVSGTIFSSLSGSTIANTAMLGSTLLPEMLRRGYDSKISLGPIVATGGIAMLVPPSALAVLLGSLAKIPIGELLIAGIVPGMLMALFFFSYIVVRCRLTPELAPAYEVPKLGAWERYGPFIKYVLPLFGIFVVVVGSIVGGLATPTESAALGALAALVSALAYRCLSLSNLFIAIRETVKITAIILLIICGSITFSQILAFSGASRGLSLLLLEAEVPAAALLIGMLLILIFLGCFMDQVSMMMITLPLFMPVVNQLGIDPVWFGVLLLIVLEISLATPPFGLLLFVMKGVAPAATTIKDVYVSTAPFIGLELLVLGLVLIWPGLAIWLPTLIAS